MLRTSICLALFTAMALLTVGTATSQAPKADPKAKADPKTKTEPPKPAGKFNLKAKSDGIRFGRPISGPNVTAPDLKGHVVFLDYWGVECPACLAAMPALAALNNELSDYGLIVLGSHVQDGTDEQIRVAPLSRGVTYQITHQTRAADDGDLDGIPHGFLFDHTGQCLWRGMPSTAGTQIRIAVGNAIVAGTGKEKFNSAAVQAVAKDLKDGKPPSTLLAKVVALKGSGGETATEAQTLLDSMTAVGLKKLKAAEEAQSADPLAAFVLIEKVPTAYKGTPVATKATELLAKLKKEKAVVAELAARPALAALKKIETPLVGTADSARMPEYTKMHGAVLKQIKAKVLEMKKSWPDSNATKEALEIAQRYAIELN